MFTKIIVSHRGKLTQDTRIVGDKIQYQIYYASATVLSNDIVITDPLDQGLSQVRVLNQRPYQQGEYDPQTHTITWRVSVSPRSRRIMVGFEAIIASTSRIRNQAFLHGEGTRPIKTNIVETIVVPSPAVGWIPFIENAQPGEPPRIYMKDETTMGTTVRFDIPGVFVYEEKVDGVTYHHLSISGRAALTDVGKPELPIVGEILEVPFGVNFAPQIIKTEVKALEGYNVYPAQPPLIDDGSSPRSFVLDKPTYLQDANYPSTLAVVNEQDIAVIRGHRVMFLKVNPIGYNPVTRVITACPMVEVRLNYSRPAQIRGVDRRIESAVFEEFLKASLLNYKDPQRFYRPPLPTREQKNGCDYLIITHDAFYNETDPNNPIVRLRNWKQRKGYTTRVVKVGSIPGGNTPNAIQTYIRDAYSQWYPVPSYVLLVGDSDLIRAFDGSIHPDNNQPPIETDLYYTTTDGIDDFPDIYIGRLPVDSLQQATDIVDKILTYEQNPPATPANTNFYNNVSLVGLFADSEDGIDGQEGRPWIANLETIREYLLSQNYTVERIYTTDSPGTSPAQFRDGTPLPNDLQPPNYLWTGGTADIANALNNGRFLVIYRAHGGSQGWAEPDFHNGDIGTLNRNDLTPVIFSITCQTGWFDNETDDDTKGGRPANQESFAETFLRRPRAGAIAILAMTRNSWTGYNDFLVFGMNKAIWPRFVPNPHWSQVDPDWPLPAIPSITPVRLLRMGQILNFGKMFMAQAYSPGSTRKIEFEMEHLFGDPEMPLWIQVPRRMTVKHPKGIGATGMQEFIVRVTDANNGLAVTNATVVLTRNNVILQMQQTQTDGRARFNLSTIGGGDLDITVTAISFRPYMGVIRVKPGGAVLNRLEPPDGPEGQAIHVGGKGFQAGESIDLYFDDQLWLVTPVANAAGEFGQGLPTVDITVPTPYPHRLVNILAYGKTSKRYAARVFQVRDKNPVDLWTYDQHDESTWSIHVGDNPTWNSPDIQLYDKSGNPVASNNLVFGETYTVKVNIRNKTAFAAPQAKVVFKWRNYGAGGPWELFHPDATALINVPANPPGIATAQNDFTPPATGHLCIKMEIEHVEDTKPSNNQGQENLHVGYSSSPTRICFLVWNLSNKPAPVHLEVRQLIQPGQEQKERLWATWVNHPDPQILQPNTHAEACVIVDPDVADVRPGTEAKFAVTAFIGNKIIGGVNLNVVKK